MATIKKSAKKVAVKKMETGGSTGKKAPVKIAYPKDKGMSAQDSAAFRQGAGARDGGQGDGYAGISENPYYKKGSDAIKKVVPKKKAKNGGKFPDLNKDGKITKADVLKGRGVIAKKGMKIGKCKGGC